MTVATGPKGSTSWGSTAPARALSSTGAMKAPRSASPANPEVDVGSPWTTSQEERSASTALRTSSRWPSEASGPIRTDSSPGLPTVMVESRAVIASATWSATASGTITRRIAVHFWPALAVISVTTPLTKRSHSGSSAPTSGPRIEQLRESASTWRESPPCSTDGCWRRMPAVWAEPVKATESWTPRWSSRSPAEPDSSCREPSGRMPDSMMRRTTSSVR